MKKIAVVLIALMFCSVAYAADTSMTITLPEAQAQRVITAMNDVYPQPPSDYGINGVPEYEYTDAQWARQCVIKFIIRTVRRSEERAARNQINVDASGVAN